MTMLLLKDVDEGNHWFELYSRQVAQDGNALSSGRLGGVVNSSGGVLQVKVIQLLAEVLGVLLKQEEASQEVGHHVAVLSPELIGDLLKDSHVGVVGRLHEAEEE